MIFTHYCICLHYKNENNIENMQKENTKSEKLIFKDYYNSLKVAEKVELRDSIVPKYIQLPTFYVKLRDNSFSLLELEKINQLTGKTFTTCKSEE